MPCLTQETVVALVEGGLSDEQAASVDDHIDECAACRSLIAQVAKSSTVREKGGAEKQESGARSRRADDPPRHGEARHSLLVADEVIADRFRIVRPMGRGSMGVVYEAVDEKLGVRIALKVLTPEASERPEYIERLHKEVILGRRVTHPNVCRLYDMDTTSDGLHFITMEYLEGETLEKRVSRGPLPMRDAWNVLRQVGDALEVAHDHGVIHRDLKPANIMLSSDNKVKVMDFGLAMDLHAERSQTGIAIGTPAYWAPEQARGERATARSDVYAMAVIFCELLGGKRPGWAEEPDVEDVPAIYHPIIRRALKVQPGERYQNIADVRADLEDAQAQLAPRRPYKRRFIVFAALGGLAFGILLTVVLVALLT